MGNETSVSPSVVKKCLDVMSVKSEVELGKPMTSIGDCLIGCSYSGYHPGLTKECAVT